MLMRFSDRTTGVKFKRDAERLVLDADGARAWPPANGRVEQLCDFGIGISPPAVNFAVSPEIAVSVGSASTRDTPARSNARQRGVRDTCRPLRRDAGAGIGDREHLRCRKAG